MIAGMNLAAVQATKEQTGEPPAAIVMGIVS